jgi:hypothetical protein
MGPTMTGRVRKCFDIIVCACGCKLTLYKYDDRGRERRFIHGHNKGDWKGGSYISPQGYRLIYKPDHPYASNGAYVREHRLVMEQHLGRYLLPNEVVHHINGDKLDNRIENLQLFSSNVDHLVYENTKDMSQRRCVRCSRGIGEAGRSNWKYHSDIDGYTCHACDNNEKYHKNSEGINARRRERYKLKRSNNIVTKLDLYP